MTVHIHTKFIFGGGTQWVLRVVMGWSILEAAPIWVGKEFGVALLLLTVSLLMLCEVE